MLLGIIREVKPQKLSVSGRVAMQYIYALVVELGASAKTTRPTMLAYAKSQRTLRVETFKAVRAR